MEKGGTTIYLWENENKFRTSCFSKYQVFKLKKNGIPSLSNGNGDVKGIFRRISWNEFREPTFCMGIQLYKFRNKISPPQKFFPLLSSPYSLLKSSR